MKVLTIIDTAILAFQPIVPISLAALAHFRWCLGVSHHRMMMEPVSFSPVECALRVAVEMLILTSVL